MCGIVGIISNNNVVPKLIQSLKQLEYRGYDSSGIAIKNNSLKPIIYKSEGKIINLEKKLPSNINGNIGIGHTRWATHGIANKINAHPHSSANVTIVHNGIIENYRELKLNLKKDKIKYISDTDSEIIAHLIEEYLTQGLNYYTAIKNTISKLEGSFAIATIFTGKNNSIIATKRGSPLLLGYGENSTYLCSDANVLNQLTKNISYMDDDEIAVIEQETTHIFDIKGNKIEKPIKIFSHSPNVVDKMGYDSYMLKEINEQPLTINKIINNYYDISTKDFLFKKINFDIKNLANITLIACGTSFYAASICKHWIESDLAIQVNVEIASEFRYKKHVFQDNSLFICISQSGETADTLACLKYLKELKKYTIAILNSDENSMSNIADIYFNILVGPEIGVASTKAFTGQLILLKLLILFIAKQQSKINQEEVFKIISQLKQLPDKITHLLSIIHKPIQNIAKKLKTHSSVLYIGRDISYKIALEGALKLKELSYIHAEALPAGELKHGSIALIDKNTPVIAIIPNDHLFFKTLSTIEEIIARKGKVIAITDKEGAKRLKPIVKNIIIIEDDFSITSPILYSIPIQLIAYYTAKYKGNNIDQPRNLAKSVTVE